MTATLAPHLARARTRYKYVPGTPGWLALDEDLSLLATGPDEQACRKAAEKQLDIECRSYVELDRVSFLPAHLFEVQTPAEIRAGIRCCDVFDERRLKGLAMAPGLVGAGMPYRLRTLLRAARLLGAPPFDAGTAPVWAVAQLLEWIEPEVISRARRLEKRGLLTVMPGERPGLRLTKEGKTLANVLYGWGR